MDRFKKLVLANIENADLATLVEWRKELDDKVILTKINDQIKVLVERSTYDFNWLNNASYEDFIKLTKGLNESDRNKFLKETYGEKFKNEYIRQKTLREGDANPLRLSYYSPDKRKYANQAIEIIQKPDIPYRNRLRIRSSASAYEASNYDIDKLFFLSNNPYYGKYEIGLRNDGQILLDKLNSAFGEKKKDLLFRLKMEHNDFLKGKSGQYVNIYTFDKMGLKPRFNDDLLEKVLHPVDNQGYQKWKKWIKSAQETYASYMPWEELGNEDISIEKVKKKVVEVEEVDEVAEVVEVAEATEEKTDESEEESKDESEDESEEKTIIVDGTVSDADSYIDDTVEVVEPVKDAAQEETLPVLEPVKDTTQGKTVVVAEPVKDTTQEETLPVAVVEEKEVVGAEPVKDAAQGETLPVAVVEEEEVVGLLQEGGGSWWVITNLGQKTDWDEIIKDNVVDQDVLKTYAKIIMQENTLEKIKTMVFSVIKIDLPSKRNELRAKASKKKLEAFGVNGNSTNEEIKKAILLQALLSTAAPIGTGDIRTVLKSESDFSDFDYDEFTDEEYGEWKDSSDTGSYMSD